LKVTPEETYDYYAWSGDGVSGTGQTKEVSYSLAGSNIIIVSSPTASVTVEIVVVELTLQTRPMGFSTWTDSTVIAAGGLDSAIHKAEVKIDVYPEVTLDDYMTLDVSLTGGGGGYSPIEWWWPKDVHRRAQLDIDGQSFQYGGSSPISFSSSQYGMLEGELRSSNRVENTTVSVSFCGETFESVVQFAGGQQTTTFGSGVYAPYQWQTVKCSSTLLGQALQGHRILFVCQTVVEPDGTNNGAVLGNSESNSKTLEYLVWVGTEKGKYQEKTIGLNGFAVGQYQVQGIQRKFTIRSVDLNIAGQ
jgi:hypothetical protein